MPLLAALLVLPLLTPAPSAHAGIIEYFRDRGEDFLDIVRLRFLVPERAEGYGVKVRATALAQVGYVHFNGNAYGMDRRAIGHNVERRTEGGLSLLYFSKNQMAYVWGNQYLDPESRWNRVQPRGVVRTMPTWDDGRLHPDSIGAEVQLGVLGFDIGLYPLEALDFAFGILTFDVYRDDRTYVDSLPSYPAVTYDYSPTEPDASEASPPEIPTETRRELPHEQDSLLGSEFIQPSDIEAFSRDEATLPPDTEALQTEPPSPPPAPEEPVAQPPDDPGATPEPTPEPTPVPDSLSD
jgi:hypothetical protein